jgi:histidinol-phosphate aminotransferase
VALTLNRYPDRDATALREKLAGFINSLSGTSLTHSNVWAANGSNEIIQSLFLAFGDNGALGFTPSYSMHPLIARVAGTEWKSGSRLDDFSLDIDQAISEITASKPGLTFITTPNNPTGSAISIGDIERLAELRQGLLVIDEAYAEFSDEESAVTLIEKYPHLIVIRTMSKAFAFAGVRLGYLIAHPAVVQSMLLVRLPYHLSALTQAAAEVAIDFKEVLLGNVSQIKADRDRVAEALTQMGLSVVPSASNFLLFSGFDIPSHQLWKSLLDHGVLIRDVGLSGYLRVTIGNEAENSHFLRTLTLCLNGAQS